MNYLKKITPIVLLLFFATGLMAQEDDKVYIRTTEKNTAYKVMGWETNVAYNPYTYTWYSWREPVVKKTTTKTVDMVPLSEFDRPPVFEDYCLTQKDMFECSNKALQEYMANHYVDYPDVAQMNNQEGLEYVTFTLNEDGKFADDMRVLSKDKPCKGCADAAADLVAGLEDKWYPAILDGKPVKTQLTIPVRFQLVNK
jgi:hypothetical protein